jgi:hypothetical protein
MKRFSLASLILVLAVPILFFWNDASAVPAFARKYHTACSTCHLAFPVRNGFGEAFRNNGYRFPDSTDEGMVKEEPIKLGQDSYKKIFPKAIWPSDIPNMPSLGFLARVAGYSQKENGKFRNTQFDEELDIFFAGTITEQISYIGDVAIASNNEPTTLGRIQLLWTFKPGITMAIGDVGFPEQFDMITMSGGTDPNGYAAQMPNPNKGAELRLTGAAGKSASYALVAGIGRNSQSDSQATRTTDEGVYDVNGSGGGGNFADTKYARLAIKIGGNGLLSGSGGKLGNNQIGLDDSVTFGFNVLNSSNGSNTNAADYTAGLTKTALGGDIRITYGNTRLVGQYTRFNQVVDTHTGENIDTGRRSAVSLEGDYWFYPWLFGAVRYERMKDNLNGEYTKIIPGIGALLRPNVKIGIEYAGVSRLNWNDLGLNNTPVSTLGFFAQVGF